MFVLTVSVSFLSVQRWWLCAWNSNNCLITTHVPSSQASWLVSDGSHRQHRWSPPRSVSATSLCPLQRDHHTAAILSVPIRSLFATFRTKPHVLLLTLTMLPSIHLFCVHCWSCRSAVLHALGNPVGRLVYRLLLHDPPLCAAAAAATQPVLVTIAALPDVAQFDLTMCSVEQAALHTLASHLVHFKKIDCVSGLSHTLHKVSHPFIVRHTIVVQSPLALRPLPRFAIASSRQPFSLPVFVGDMCSPI